MVANIFDEVASPVIDLGNRITKPRIGRFWGVSIIIGAIIVLITFAIQAFIFRTANKINAKFAKKMGFSLENPKLLHGTYLSGDIDSDGIVKNIKNSEIKNVAPNMFQLDEPGFYMVSYSFTVKFPRKAYLTLNNKEFAYANASFIENSADTRNMNCMELFIVNKKKQIINFITNAQPIQGKFNLIYLGNL